MNESNPSVPGPTVAVGAKASGRPWVEWGMALVVIGLLGLMFAGAWLWPIYFDERVHLNNLWMISQGLHPYRDFWCHYPATGYAPYLPIFWLVSQSATALLVLRLLSVLIVAAVFAVICRWSWKLNGRWWLPLLPALLLVTADGTIKVKQDDLSAIGKVISIPGAGGILSGGTARILAEFRTDGPAMLLAIVSISLLLGEARGWKRVLALACAVVSLALMPKYIYVLLGCGVFDFMGQWIEKRLTRGTILESLTGVMLGLLASWGLTLAALATPADTWRWGFLLQAQFQAHVLATSNLQHFFSDLLAPFLYHDWWLALSVAVGVGAFLIWAKKNRWRGPRAWIGYGLLAGVGVTIGMTKMPFDQYLVPVVLPLFFLFPFVGFLLDRVRRPVLGEGLLLALLLLTLLWFARRDAQRMPQSPFFADMAQENKLEAIVPKNERVLGPFTVLFRRPQTFLTCDEVWGNPPGYGSLVQDDPRVAREFTTARLIESLRQSKPALIHLSVNFPPGWLPVMLEFVQENEQSYELLDLPEETVYVRRDIYPAQSHP